MAIAIAHCHCWKCGAEFTIRAQRTNRAAANDYEEWAAENIDLCPDCYRTEQREKRRAEMSDVFQLPALTGSPKQIPWAGDLRLKFCASARRMWADDELMLKVIQIVLSGKCSARWWIDNRFEAAYADTLLDRILRITAAEDVALVRQIQALASEQTADAQ